MQLVLSKTTKTTAILLFFLCFLNVEAQLGFCKGNTGDPIFTEDFGSGIGNVKLPFGTTTYKFTKNRPKDGCYVVSNTHKHFNWYKLQDHTTGDKNGRMLIVNAGYEPGEFFRVPVSGLCENTSYEFSSWIVNLTREYTKACGRGIPIDVTFEIWNKSNKTLLASGSTGAIYGGNTPTWLQYALVFQTRPNETSVILKIRNNGKGGCGNDLALDDIEFKPCGDNVIIEDRNNKKHISVNKSYLPFSTTLTLKPDYTVFSSHFYQWQTSKDGKNWEDILGAKKETYKIPATSSKVFYRAKVAENAQNLNNALCYSYSDFYEIRISKEKPIVLKRPEVKTITNLVKKGLAGVNIAIEVPKITRMYIDRKRLAKTYKTVIIVKNGYKILTDKVWIDGAVGKYVQTTETVIKQGHALGDTVINETLYYKSVYGYNCIKRTYTVKTKL
ncbi:hypothetical protein [Hyunsoonleella pacifica]|uniref:Gliding motility-associated C-terminal domain-containing protein n=1 Tax=Hyunsoonleella pacifica TaxID=1080224 RepID=A0A4Q9FLY1_9FLAO|nr:hypothetical protein [Hyunsoonleella pacifica]TBN14670.1 hypothetical protein EYD46_13970 [Hyunsoonleella pacifica]GGD15710.1 hypothetical protein GCM10011368_17100 [Hyunsoonleella pacifica]